MTTENKRPLMAEMLVRHVLGESESFERVCAQRGVGVEEAVRHALRTWAGQGLRVVEPSLMPGMVLNAGLTPDPGDCPRGQEFHWLAMCEHDLELLRKRQSACFKNHNVQELEVTTRAIENYIQTIAALKARVA